MSQYIIHIKNEQQGEALLEYLKSLTFVEVEAFVADAKTEAIERAKSFLKQLPEQPQRQSAINKAIKELRQEHDY
ncbi:MAG: hypothetical protein MUE30_02000 [Spirosomaceae bacterium]|jgi:O-acetylhomoserine/O-acetylserine sulfhydrylase-like pyridoxal-dependent enzyme|nr:hypothetical protein [Spirosomataceae bacterium]